jgi:gluconate 5-dehydrogenase
MTHPLFDLSGKTALITGSSRGLGRAFAEGLAQAGARIVLNGVNPQRRIGVRPLTHASKSGLLIKASFISVTI